MRMYNSKLDRIVYKLNGLLLCAVIISILYPLVYILIASFTDPVTLLNEGISFNVSEWTLEGYITILSDPAMIRGFINSFIYSTLFALLSVSTSVMAGYALAQKELVGRSFISNIFVVTMFWGWISTNVFIDKELRNVRYNLGHNFTRSSKRVEYNSF